MPQARPKDSAKGFVYRRSFRTWANMQVRFGSLILQMSSPCVEVMQAAGLGLDCQS